MQVAFSTATRRDRVRFPGRLWVTYGLMLAIIAAMCLEIFVALNVHALESMLHTYGLVSLEFSWSDPAAYIPLVTFNFLHSGSSHFASNAIVMLFACAAVERHIGRRATLFVWLTGGIVAGVAHLFVMPNTAQSLVGASGAISAILGAAFIVGWHWTLPVRLRRSGRLLFSIPFPAVTAIWVTFQAISFARNAPHLSAGATIATWVHLAGFSFGLLAAGALCLYRLHSSDKQLQPWCSLATD